MDPIQQYLQTQTRRTFLARSGTGFGAAALTSLLNAEGVSGAQKQSATGGLPGIPHFAPKAKRAI